MMNRTELLFAKEFLKDASFGEELAALNIALDVARVCISQQLGYQECYLCAIRKITKQSTTIDNRTEYFCSECGKNLFPFTPDDARYTKDEEE